MLHLNYHKLNMMQTMVEIERLKQELANTKSELQEVKLKFEHHNKLFQEILESTLAGYWDFNYITGKGLLSKRFKSMFGYSDAEIPNEPHIWKEYVHPDDLVRAEKDFNKHLLSKGDVPYSNELRYLHKDGSIVWVYCKGSVIEWTNEGAPVRMVGCHVDITPFKKALNVVAAQKDELIIKNRELEQFANVVSHDIKEPLRTITNLIEVYRKEFPLSVENERAIEYLTIIENSSLRVNELIDALLDYTKIGWEPKFVRTDLNHLVTNVIDDLKLLIDVNQVTYVVNDLPNLNVYPTELSNLFQNLISNAIKFSSKNKLPFFEISAERKGSMWEFNVKDNGIGIAKDHYERIFIIFKRLQKVKGIKGEGVGLAQCKKIIDLHKGKIWVESEENAGSSFKFTLPIV